jgi:protein-S-isoprenylcysteine O-methyltransferase Ste14
VQTKHLIGALVALLLYLFLVPALLFIAAGTVNWPMAWVYAGLLLASTIGSRLIVFKRNPDTLRERARFTTSEGTEPWDRVLVLIVGAFGPAATMIVAGLDHRWAWSASLPLPIQILAALGIAVGYGVAVWAMVENRYFSSVARIQSERGQEVVTTGPYRLMRHPSYAGAILACLVLPLVLEALWAYIPALLMAAATAIRTGLEDRMLRGDLEGYERYAQQTRYRLLPGLW